MLNGTFSKPSNEEARRQLPPASEEEDPTLALFAEWGRQDAQMTPKEIAEENRQWEEFKANINVERDRAGARRVF